MEQVARRILPFCIACLLAVGVLTAPLRGNAATWDGGGEPSTPSLGSSSLEDLLRRLDDREPEITLTGDIELNGDFTLATAFNAPVTIHMGDYGIRMLEGANLYLNGPITFTGEGDTVPLFRLEQDASMTSYVGDLGVTATGDNAVALSMGPGTRLLCNELEIRATGSDSTAVEIQGEARLFQLRVAAKRQDCVAISADSDLYLDSCTVSGEINVAGDLVLDLSSVSPMPEHARIIRRQALWLYDFGIDLGIFGYSAVAGQSNPLPDLLDMKLVDVDGVEENRQLRGVSMIWDTGSQDLSHPGTYTVHGTPGLDQLPGLKGVERTAIQVQIVESGRPYLTGAHVPSSFVELHYLQPIEDAEEMLLHHSTNGKAWTLLDEDQITLNEWGAMIRSLEHEQTHYFQLEIIGGSFAGRSNILYFWLDENGDTGTGGTRDGTGQEGGEDPGPPPDEGNGNSGGTDEGNADSGNTGSGRTSSGSGSSIGWDKPDSDATIPVFGAAQPITEETPPPQPVEDPAATTLTAPQLSTLLEVNPGQLAFHENGMTVVIPSELLAALALGKESLTVSMGMDGADGFRISIFSGEGEIISFDGQAFQLWIPYEVDSEALEHLYILDHTGAEQFADDYEDGRLLFHLTHTGSYTILDKRESTEAVLETVDASQQPPSQEEPLPLPEEPAEDGGRFPILPVAVALTVILVAGGAVLLYKRGGKRLGGKAE